MKLQLSKSSRKLSKLYRLRMYRIILKELQSLNLPSLPENLTIFKITGTDTAGMCHIIVRHSAGYSEAFMSQYPELAKHEPYKMWRTSGYWFHPYDTKSRIKILEEIIKEMDVNPLVRLLSYLHF